MDLFGRKARAALTSAHEELSKLQADNMALLKLVEAASDICANKDRKIQALNLEAVELRGNLDAMTLVVEAINRPPAPFSSQPLYLNEQEEDIEYAFKNELIDKATYEDMLAQLQFDNTEITFDYS